MLDSKYIELARFLALLPTPGKHRVGWPPPPVQSAVPIIIIMISSVVAVVVVVVIVQVVVVVVVVVVVIVVVVVVVMEVLSQALLGLLEARLDRHVLGVWVC